MGRAAVPRLLDGLDAAEVVKPDPGMRVDHEEGLERIVQVPHELRSAARIEG